jgi:transposase
MQTPNDLSRSLTVLEQDSALIAVIERSLSSWLVAGIVPGVERQPLKKLCIFVENVLRRTGALPAHVDDVLSLDSVQPLPPRLRPPRLPLGNCAGSRCGFP